MVDQTRWIISFEPVDEETYRVTVRRPGSMPSRFEARLPPDISDLWDSGPADAPVTRSMRGDPATLTPEARFFQAANLPTLKEIGERLLTSTFNPGNNVEGTEIVGALKERIGDPGGLELAIDLSQAAELSGIPWESFYLRTHDSFLGTGTKSNIVRKLDTQGGKMDDIALPIRLLVVAANPRADLDTDAELGNINRRITQLVATGDTKFDIQSLANAKRAEFSRKVSDWRPHIIHYIGHSAFSDGEGFLFFEGEEEGESDRVSAEELRNMLRNFRPWLVVLNSCQSGQTSRENPMAGVAQNLLQRLNLPFVVAMQQPVSDDAAINFSQEFYAALTAGEMVANAVTLGRCAISNNADVRTKVELITPALYTSGEFDRFSFADLPGQVAPPPIDDEDDEEEKTTRSGKSDNPGLPLLKRLDVRLAIVATIMLSLGTIGTQSKTIYNLFFPDEDQERMDGGIAGNDGVILADGGAVHPAEVGGEIEEVTETTTIGADGSQTVQIVRRIIRRSEPARRLVPRTVPREYLSSGEYQNVGYQGGVPVVIGGGGSFALSFVSENYLSRPAPELMPLVSTRPFDWPAAVDCSDYVNYIDQDFARFDPATRQLRVENGPMLREYARSMERCGHGWLTISAADISGRPGLARGSVTAVANAVQDDSSFMLGRTKLMVIASNEPLQEDTIQGDRIQGTPIQGGAVHVAEPSDGNDAPDSEWDTALYPVDVAVHLSYERACPLPGQVLHSLGPYQDVELLRPEPGIAEQAATGQMVFEILLYTDADLDQPMSSAPTYYQPAAQGGMVSGEVIGAGVMPDQVVDRSTGVIQVDAAPARPTPRARLDSVVQQILAAYGVTPAMIHPITLETNWAQGCRQLKIDMNPYITAQTLNVLTTPANLSVAADPADLVENGNEGHASGFDGSLVREFGLSPDSAVTFLPNMDASVDGLTLVSDAAYDGPPVHLTYQGEPVRASAWTADETDGEPGWRMVGYVGPDPENTGNQVFALHLSPDGAYAIDLYLHPDERPASYTLDNLEGAVDILLTKVSDQTGS